MFDSYINNLFGALLYAVLYLGPTCEPGFWLPLDASLFVVGVVIYRMQTRAIKRKWPNVGIGVRLPIATFSISTLLMGIVFGAIELQNAYPDVLAIPFETCRL